jgi:hypothetical protein
MAGCCRRQASIATRSWIVGVLGIWAPQFIGQAMASGDSLADSSASPRRTTPAERLERVRQRLLAFDIRNLPQSRVSSSPRPVVKRSSATPEFKADIKIADPAIVRRAPREIARFSMTRLSNGLISIDCVGQPWEAVLEWLAAELDLHLVLVRVPPGQLDFKTRRAYSLQELRDALDALLLAKGFVTTSTGHGLLVTNFEALGNLEIPLIPPEELKSRGKYELLRTSFDLETAGVSSAMSVITPLLSRFGSATPLRAMNRIVVIDTADHLREIESRLSEEQGFCGSSRLVRRFAVVHLAAEDALSTLRPLLRHGGARSAQPGTWDPSEPRIAVNRRDNSLLVCASHDTMMLIDATLQFVDVASPTRAVAEQYVLSVEHYRVKSISVASFIASVTSLGLLHPTTVIEEEEESRFVVRGRRNDQDFIRSLISKIEPAPRDLWTLAAPQQDLHGLAQAITRTMALCEPRLGRSTVGSSSGAPPNGFEVVADPVHQRLLIRANAVEWAEIEILLAKLRGEETARRNGSSRESGQAKQTVPDKYNDPTTTELSATVEKGKADGYNFDLKSG